MSTGGQCAGVFGRLLGHEYVAAYNSTMSAAGGRFLDGVSSLSGPRAPAFVESLKDRTLAGHVCRRCGASVAASLRAGVGEIPNS